jgi:hypothetical protein
MLNRDDIRQLRLVLRQLDGEHAYWDKVRANPPSNDELQLAEANLTGINNLTRVIQSLLDEHKEVRGKRKLR